MYLAFISGFITGVVTVVKIATIHHNRKIRKAAEEATPVAKEPVAEEPVAKEPVAEEPVAEGEVIPINRGSEQRPIASCKECGHWEEDPAGERVGVACPHCETPMACDKA